MQTPRALATLKLLADGKVQIIGGDAELSMEVFDPSNGIFIAKALLPPNASFLAQRSARKAARRFFRRWSARSAAPRVLTPEQLALLDRADQSITELPSRNQALVAGGINSAGQILNSAKLVSSSTASVTTDKTDYAPGQIVTITGSGFQPNEQVDIYFHEFPEEYPDIFFLGVANQQGNFVATEFAPQEIDLGRIFTLTAIGQTSGFTAQTAFHDNKNFVITFVGTGSGSVTFTGVTTSPSPSPNPCTGTCSVALDNNATGTITAAANVGSVFGGWSAIVTNGNGSITCTANSCTFNMGSGSGAPKAITVTFTAAAVTTTTVTSSANPSTYGQSVTFTASVKVGATAVTSGSVTFIEGGTCAAPTTTLAGPTALNGSGQAAFSTSTLTVPLHTIIACYGGAAGFNSSNGSVTQTVNPATTTITISAAPITYNANGSVTVTVTSTAGTPTGSVMLAVDGGTPFRRRCRADQQLSLTRTLQR